MATRVAIVDGPLPPLRTEPSRADAGAELIFLGRVRGLEHDEPIVALHYEHYAGMAERELARVAEQVASRHDGIDLWCVHRVGDVPVGEPSLRVVVRSPHRGDSLEALEAFVTALKRDVPIWKWGVRADGSRFPA